MVLCPLAYVVSGKKIFFESNILEELLSVLVLVD